MPNQYTITVEQPLKGPLIVEPASLPVQGDNDGDLISVTWIPRQGTQITSVAGFPSGVSVSGPNAQGGWTGSYNASSIPSIWSYYISAINIENRFRNDWHDPEIDNTPPPI
ncbi:MAG TPA: hypothetical protein VM733_18785 [Thermoanaerobaculia bacterium]|nr:hypothetical protein [Thermoanaerobaculia bacterium]